LPDKGYLGEILHKTTPSKGSQGNGTPEKPAGQQTTSADADPDELTIGQMDGKYSTMRPGNKELARMHVILKDGSVQTFQFAHLDAKSVFNGQKFVLQFIGAKHWAVEIEGRNIWRMYDYCTLKRWPYIREATRDFGQDEETVTTKVTITDITPRDN
jgi:hypothetical protein